MRLRPSSRPLVALTLAGTITLTLGGTRLTGEDDPLLKPRKSFDPNALVNPAPIYSESPPGRNPAAAPGLSDRLAPPAPGGRNSPNQTRPSAARPAQPRGQTAAPPVNQPIAEKKGKYDADDHREGLGSDSSTGFNFHMELPPEQITSSGGLVGAIDRIARLMQLPPTHVAAQAVVSVTSRLDNPDDGPWTVTLQVSGAKVEIDPDMPGDTAAILQQEIAFLQQQINEFSFTLSPELRQQLLEQGSLTIEVVRPMSVVKTWRKTTLSTTVRLGPPPPKITGVKFFVVGRSGVYPTGDLVAGMPAYAEVQWDREPKESAVTIEFDGGAGPQNVRALKLDDQPALFRTGRFLPWSDDGGLGPPPPTSRSSNEAVPGSDGLPPNAIPNVAPKAGENNR
jgi:hypothetical protein